MTRSVARPWGRRRRRGARNGVAGRRLARAEQLHALERHACARRRASLETSTSTREPGAGALPSAARHLQRHRALARRSPDRRGRLAAREHARQ